MCHRPNLEGWLTTIAISILVASVGRADTISFLVAERPGAETHGDSYVLPLSNPDDVSYARRLISEGPDIGGAIAVARIEKGGDGINRDLLAAGAPEWSWHVTEFMGFADFTVEILDGWPGFVEQDVDAWMQNTGGFVGFWNYTVVAEVSPRFALQAGDADQDLDFDQFDLLLVQQAGKYLTGLPAAWDQGDWDNAPGGSPGMPPPGDGVFDQKDIIAALRGGFYLTGRYAAIAPSGVDMNDIPVPEPSAPVLAVIGLLCLAAKVGAITCRSLRHRRSRCGPTRWPSLLPRRSSAHRCGPLTGKTSHASRTGNGKPWGN